MFLNEPVSSETLERKLINLTEMLHSLNSVCIAYSGGVDSTFLVKVAKDVLKENVVAITATSPIYPLSELEEARALAEMMGVKYLIIESNELEIPEFSQNKTDRCYYCKSGLFEKVEEVAKKCLIQHIADGSNYDDLKDHRPGRRAAKERDVLSPLVETELTKEEIRFLSRRIGLPTWKKPSLACLASRIPYYEKITEEKLRRVENAERVLREMGFTQVRVRHHKQMARVELLPEEMSPLSDSLLRVKIHAALKGLGFDYITLDLLGYRTGSMNEVIQENAD